MEAISLGLLLLATPSAGVLLFYAHSRWVAQPQRFPDVVVWTAVALNVATVVCAVAAAAEGGRELVSDSLQYAAALFVGAVVFAFVLYLARLPRTTEDSRHVDGGLRGFGWAFLLLPLLFVIGIPFTLLIGLAYFALLWFRWRRQKQAGAMTVLSGFVSLGRPLSGLFQVSQRRGSGWRRRMNDFAYNTQTGMSLADAVEYAGIASPTDAILLRAAELGGAVERELPRIAGQSNAAVRSGWRRGGVLGLCFYIEFLTIAGLLIGLFMLYFIVPKLKFIFDDFGVELPSVAQQVMLVGNETASNGFALVGNVAIWLIAILFTGFIAVAGTRVLPQMLLERGPRNWSSPTVLRVIATLIESGKSLSTCVRELAGKARSTFWEQRWMEVAELADEGNSAAKILTLTRDLDAKAARGLEAGAGLGPNGMAAQASLLRTVADATERVAQRRFAALSIGLSAILFSLIAAGVAVGAFAMISCLAMLIEHLAIP